MVWTRSTAEYPRIFADMFPYPQVGSCAFEAKTNRSGYVQFDCTEKDIVEQVFFDTLSALIPLSLALGTFNDSPRLSPSWMVADHPIDPDTTLTCKYLSLG